MMLLSSVARALIATTIMVISVILGGCDDGYHNNSKSKNSNDNNNNTLFVDIGGEPNSLDPALAEDATSFRVVNDLFAGLVDYDQSNKVAPGMAISWNVSPDGLTYTFNLRHNLQFSDGQVIRAHDFVYSYRRLIDPRTASPYAFILADIANANDIINGKKSPQNLAISAPDDYHVVITLAHPSDSFLLKLTLPSVAVVKEGAIKRYGKQWTNPKYIVTSGAYKLTKHVVNGELIASTNPYYYDKSKVKIDTVKYYPIVNTATSIASYKAGDLDTTWQNIPSGEHSALKNQFTNQLNVVLAERLQYISYNMRSKIFAHNLYLRQALSMAIEREIIANKVINMNNLPLYSVVSATIDNGIYKDYGYDWRTLPQAKRLKLAKELYAKAGYSKLHPLTITLKYRNNDLDKKAALAVASMWHNVLGVKVNLANLDYRMLLQALYKGDFEVALSTFGADFNNVMTYLPIYSCHNAYNYSHYCDESYDALLAKADVAIANKDKQELYGQAINKMLANYIVIPLLQPSRQRLVRTRVLNYDINHNYLDNVQSKWFSLSKNRTP